MNMGFQITEYTIQRLNEMKYYTMPKLEPSMDRNSNDDF